VDPAASGRRLVAAAGEAWRAGQPDRVTTLLERARPLVADAWLRAESDHLLGLIGLRRGSLLDAGVVLIEGAAQVAAVDPRKAFEMLVDAGSLAGRSGDTARMAEVGRMIAALPRSEDAGDALLADLLVGVCSLIEGKTADAVPLILDGVARAGASDDTRALSWAATGASTVGDLASEAALLRRAVRIARASGAVDTLVLILETVVSSALLSGRLDFEAEAAEGLALATEADLVNARVSFVAALAWAAALRGDDEASRAHAVEVTRSVGANGLANANSIAEWALALLDLCGGRPEATIARLVGLAARPSASSIPSSSCSSRPSSSRRACAAGARGRRAPRSRHSMPSRARARRRGRWRSRRAVGRSWPTIPPSPPASAPRRSGCTPKATGRSTARGRSSSSASTCAGGGNAWRRGSTCARR
jgi:hypothetical protein